MARGASKPNGVRPNRHGVHINGDGEVPPPSTLAAQIVQKQTRSAATQRQPQTAEDTTLANLLHEMLYNPAAAQETDANVNVQLVNVVAEAGLGPLAIDDPFAQLDMLLPQARDSIAVIDKTIRRQPELLFTPVVDDGPQLLLPLCARLSAVCGRPRCESLSIPSFLDGCVRVLIASTELWQNARALQETCQDIVDGE